MNSGKMLASHDLYICSLIKINKVFVLINAALMIVE